MTQSECYGVGAATSANLVIGVDEVPLDGGDREAELAGNLLVGRTLRYLPKHLHLSSRESVRCRNRPGGRSCICVRRRLGYRDTVEKAVDPCLRLVVGTARN
jgi:hypothetical protein